MDKAKLKLTGFQGNASSPPVLGSQHTSMFDQGEIYMDADRTVSTQVGLDIRV